jgi:hypothetical protein
MFTFIRLDPLRRSQMLLTNPIIEVNGDTATAHVIWIGVLNEGIGTVPSLYEQGRRRAGDGLPPT